MYGGAFNASAMYAVFAWSLAQPVEYAEQGPGEPLRIVEFYQECKERNLRIAEE